MYQIWISKAGPPEVLEVREAADPTPGPGQVRIRVHAAGLNFADILARMGLYPDAPKLPTVVGYEVAGEVDLCGEGEQISFTPGTRVLALTRFGGHSDCVVVPAEQVVAIPDGLSYPQAAAIPVNYLTAWLMLVHLSHVQAGTRVLIHAAAGGVGQAAVQICKWKQAEMFATASSSKHERLRAMGVHHCIDYHNQDFAREIHRLTSGHGVDIVLDAVGGKSFRQSYQCLASLGRLFLFGVSSFAPKNQRSIVSAAKGFVQMPWFNPISLMNSNRGVHGINLGHLWNYVPLLAGMMQQIVKLTETGIFTPVVAETFSFAEAAKAHAYIQARKNFGKVILLPSM